MDRTNLRVEVEGWVKGDNHRRRRRPNRAPRAEAFATELPQMRQLHVDRPQLDNPSRTDSVTVADKAAGAWPMPVVTKFQGCPLTRGTITTPSTHKHRKACRSVTQRSASVQLSQVNEESSVTNVRHRGLATLVGSDARHGTTTSGHPGDAKFRDQHRQNLPTLTSKSRSADVRFAIKATATDRP